MTEISNKDELRPIGELVKGLIESMAFLWIPVTDESLEREYYRSTNNGNTVTYLPWAPINPSGTSSANYVVLNLEDMTFYYLSSRKFCVSYTITTTKTIFRLRGLCQDSYIGKLNHLSPSVFLLADIFYVAVNSIHLFKYTGITSTNV